MNTKVVDVKFFNKKDLGILLQTIFSILFVTFGILYLINKKYEIIFYIIVSLLLFVLSFNNKVIFKKKYMTLVYLITAIVILLITVMEAIL